MDKHILFTLPSTSEDEEHTVLRLTVGPVTALGMARYRKYVREANAWLEARFGPRLAADEEDDGDDDEQAERQLYTELVYPRAYMLACLKQVDTGTCAPAAPQPDTWQASELPAAWLTCDGFATQLPGALFAAWDAAVTEANPNVFWVNLSDPNARRPGGVIVTSPATR